MTSSAKRETTRTKLQAIKRRYVPILQEYEDYNHPGGHIR
jgi:hypothetical protein